MAIWCILPNTQADCPTPYYHILVFLSLGRLDRLSSHGSIFLLLLTIAILITSVQDVVMADKCLLSALPFYRIAMLLVFDMVDRSLMRELPWLIELNTVVSLIIPTIVARQRHITV